MLVRHAGLALLGLVLLSAATPTQAQVTTVDQTCLVGGQAGHGQIQIATNCPIGRIPALQSFRFGFLNGNHRFRVATLMPNGESFEAAWADVGGEDPVFVEARWLRVPEAPGGVVTAVVQGVADIPIPPGPANHTLVLSGFEFRRQDGSDANIRTIALQTDSARSTIRTVLLDDQNMNFEQLAVAVGVGFTIGATGVPDPNISSTAMASTLSLFSMTNRTLTPGEAHVDLIPAENAPALTPMIIAPNAAVLRGVGRPAAQPQQQRGSLGAAQGPRQARISQSDARPYRVRVAYLWVPNARLANTRMVSGSGRYAAQTSGRLPGRTPHVLQGFSFHFGNSDHFIGGFGVHLAGGAPVQTAVPRTELVTWEDSDRDDPMQWTVRFSELVPPR